MLLHQTQNTSQHCIKHIHTDVLVNNNYVVVNDQEQYTTSRYICRATKTLGTIHRPVNTLSVIEFPQYNCVSEIKYTWTYVSGSISRVTSCDRVISASFIHSTQCLAR